MSEVINFPSDVLNIVHHYISCRKNGFNFIGLEDNQEPENFLLPVEFVNVVKYVLDAHQVPLDHEGILPEKCRDQICDIAWVNIDQIIAFNSKD